MLRIFLTLSSFVFLLAGCSPMPKQEFSSRVIDLPKGPSSYVSEDQCGIHPHEHNEIDRAPSSSDCKDVTRQERDDIQEMIQTLGGELKEPEDYEFSTQGLQNYLDDVGVNSKFSAEEMVRPYNPIAAQSCGRDHLLPPHCRWASGAVQALMAMKLRGVINDGDEFGRKGIRLRNWWRPKCYNQKVGGAGASDHIQARGFDLDFATPDDRAKAQKYLCQMYKERPFNLQVGIGCQTLHVGVGSPKRLWGFPENGARFWTYGSLQSCRLKRLIDDDCWVVTEDGKKNIFSDEKKKSFGAL